MRTWLILALAVPALLWTAYWGAAAFAVKQGAERFVQEQRHGDLSSRFAELRIGGFPTDLRFDFEDVQVQDADRFVWSVPVARLSAPAYRPQDVRLDLSGPQKVEGRFGDLDIQAEVFDIGLLFRLAASVPLARVQLIMEAGRLAHASGWRLDAERLLVTFQEPANSAADTAGDLSLYRLGLEGRALDLSGLLIDLPPDYQEITDVTARMGLAFSRPWDRSLLETGPPDLRGLIIDQGQIRFGEATLTLSGQLAVSADGLLSGHVDIELQGWRAVLAAFRQTDFLDPDIADLILDFLGPETDDQEAARVPLQFQDGMVSFGIFTLGFLPPLP